MQTISGFFKGVFYFFVGDWIILIGIAITVALVALLETVVLQDNMKSLGGYVFILGVLITLGVTLRRETGH